MSDMPPYNSGFPEQNPYQPSSKPFPDQPTGQPPAIVKTLAIIFLVLTFINLMVTLTTPWTNEAFQNFSKDLVKQIVVDAELKAEILESMDEEDPFAEIQMIVVIVIGALLAILRFYGGYQMMTFGSYGWALAGMILAIIPCGTCCCLFDLGIGIWGIVLLSNNQVKSHFS